MLTQESFMPDEDECVETLREIRWSDGVRCVDCDSATIECRTETYREHYARYECLDCGRWFNDLSDTIFEYSKIALRYWFYTMREMDKGLPTTEIAQALPYSYPATLNMVHTLQECQYQAQLSQRLSGEVEGDDVHLKTGRQGEECDHRAPRSRGLKARGRGRYETDRPPVVVWVERHSPRMAITMCRDASARTLVQNALRHIVPESRIDTDTWRGYNWLDTPFEHHTVKHSERYVADDGAHCNTAEAEWSVFRPWWATARGISKKHAHRYLAQYQYERNRRDYSSLERLHDMIGLAYAVIRRLFHPRNAPASVLTFCPLQPF